MAAINQNAYGFTYRGPHYPPQWFQVFIEGNNVYIGMQDKYTFFNADLAQGKRQASI